MVLVFQQGHGAELLGVEQTGPIMSLMPIFLVGIVFGLAMDYEVFLVSRMREAYVHLSPGIRDLTNREREAMKLAADGKSNDEIAGELHLACSQCAPKSNGR